MPNMIASVTDKTGLADFVRVMQHEFDFNVYASGGTYKALLAAGLRVTEIAEYTQFPEMMDDRVKTLHPMVHGGILGLPQHQQVMDEHGIVRFDLVVVNFYKFADAVKENLPLGETLKKIDVGGPTMACGPVKNFGMCAPVVRPEFYDKIIESYRQCGDLDANLRLVLGYTSARAVAEFYSSVADYYQGVTVEQAVQFLADLRS